MCLAAVDPSFAASPSRRQRQLVLRRQILEISHFSGALAFSSPPWPASSSDLGPVPFSPGGVAFEPLEVITIGLIIRIGFWAYIILYL